MLLCGFTLFVSDHIVINFCTVLLHNDAAASEFMAGFHQEGVPTMGVSTNIIPNNNYYSLPSGFDFPPLRNCGPLN